MLIPDSLDPADFVIVPNVYVLDEFDMTDDEGNVVARIDAKFIEKTVRRMQERESETGDLCPIVIGHTKDKPEGSDEINGPPLIGYFRNWKQIPFFDTGKTAAAPDAWIFKGDVERARKFPRRSGEVWLTKYEVDPVSFLGATTPARDLGLLKLSRTGSITYAIGIGGSIFDRPVRLERSAPSPTNRESEMADDKKTDDKTDKTKEGDVSTSTKRDDKPKADEGQSGKSKTTEGLLNEILARLDSLEAKITGGAPAAADASAAAPATDAATGDDGEVSDDELNQFLAQFGGEEGAAGEGDAAAAGAPATDEDAEKNKSRKGEESVKNDASYAGGNNTFVPNADVVKRLSRVEEENEVLRAKLARQEVQARLQRAADDGAALDPKDEKLISDLVIMPEDVRENMVVRLSRNKSKTADAGHANDALKDSTNNNEKRYVRTPEERATVMKLARQKGVSYDIAAVELGFTIGSPKK